MRDHHTRKSGIKAGVKYHIARRRMLSTILPIVTAVTVLVGSAESVSADDDQTINQDAITTQEQSPELVAPGGELQEEPELEELAPEDEPADYRDVSEEPVDDYHGADTPEAEGSDSTGDEGTFPMGPFRTAPRHKAPGPRSIPRCGLRTALVFDLSNSVGAKGLHASKEAGKTVVDIVAGTSTTLSIVNFGTNTPADVDSEVINAAMSVPQEVEQAKRTVDRMSLPGGRDGGTNWADTLRRLNQAADRGEKYDVVYFITDGKPTAPVGGGVVTNDSDIIRAQREAAALISKGTHIVGVGVGFQRNHDDQVIVHPDPEYGRAVRGHEREATSAYRRPGTHAASVRIPGVSSQPAQKGHVVFVTSQLKMLETISLERIILPNGFEHLRDELKRAFAGCSAKVVINKEIVNDRGQVQGPGAGFDFTSQLYRTDGGRVEKIDGQKVRTDDRGVATLTVPTVVGNDGLEPGTVEVSENLADMAGWQQFHVQGKTALCTAKDGDGRPKTVVGTRAPARPEPDTIYVENSRNTKGFIVRNVKHFDTVECTVKNLLADADFSLSKENASEPLALNGDKDQQLTATYRLTLRNNATHEAHPGAVVEAPQALPGMQVVEIRGAGDLLSVPDVTLERSGRVWLIPAEKVQPVPAGAERSVLVTVAYRVSNPTQVLAKHEALLCRTDTHHKGQGLVNNAVLKKDDKKRDKWASACVDVVPPTEGDFEISKKELHSPVVVTGSQHQELTARYKVALKNNSQFAAIPRELTEVPTALPGMSIATVSVAGNLVKKPQVLRKNHNGWTIPTTELNKIEPNQISTMQVDVRYRVTDPHALAQARERHECAADDGEKGLVNRVLLAASTRDEKLPERSAQACVSVALPELNVDKRVYTQQAYTREQAYPLAPTATEVHFNYRFNTGAYPLDVIRLNDVVRDPDTGVPTGEQLDLSGLRCTGAQFVPGTPDQQHLVVAPGHRGDISCQLVVTDPKVIATPGAYSHTTLIAHGHYTVPEHQASPRGDAPQLTGEASAWIFTFPALVGELPRSGGPGTGWYLRTGSFMVLLAGMATACVWLGRNRGNSRSHSSNNTTS